MFDSIKELVEKFSLQKYSIKNNIVYLPHSLIYDITGYQNEMMGKSDSFNSKILTQLNGLFSYKPVVDNSILEDYFGNIIEPGDLVCFFNHGIFQPGVYLGAFSKEVYSQVEFKKYVLCQVEYDDEDELLFSFDSEPDEVPVLTKKTSTITKKKEFYECEIYHDTFIQSSLVPKTVLGIAFWGRDELDERDIVCCYDWESDSNYYGTLVKVLNPEFSVHRTDIAKTLNLLEDFRAGLIKELSPDNYPY